MRFARKHAAFNDVVEIALRGGGKLTRDGTVVSVLLRNPDLAAVPELLFRHEPEYQQRAQCSVRAGGICIK